MPTQFLLIWDHKLLLWEGGQFQSWVGTLSFELGFHSQVQDSHYCTAMFTDHLAFQRSKGLHPRPSQPHESDLNKFAWYFPACYLNDVKFFLGYVSMTDRAHRNTYHGSKLKDVHRFAVRVFVLSTWTSQGWWKIGAQSTSAVSGACRALETWRVPLAW